jgi:hypothetical protein
MLAAFPASLGAAFLAFGAMFLLRASAAMIRRR